MTVLPESKIIPSSLKKGDKVALISTARKISEQELEFAVELLQSWGLVVVFGKHLFEEYHQFAGTDEQRAADLQAAINDPAVKAILCVRGGYGTVRIVDRVDFTPLQQHPKWIAGYSDVTVLHSALHQLGIASIHSSMPINFSTNTATALQSLRDALMGDSLNHQGLAHPLNRPGEARGEVIGGNLSILYSLLGSDTSIDTKGKILFIEDLDEYIYHIDRMMMNLKRNAKLSELAALVVGGMSDMHDNSIPFGATAKEIIREAVEEYDYPLCFDFPAGHIDDNRSLWMGVKANLSVSDSVHLTYEHS